MAQDDCLRCGNLPCVNLFFKGDELQGGELYVLEEEITKGRLLPCSAGCALYACCKLWTGANKKLEQKEKFSPLLITFRQCLYDLKTSIFLALTAHYRGAIQQLRPVLENAIAGLWFTAELTGEDGEEDKTAISNFWKWMEGKYETPKFADMVKELRSDLFLVNEKTQSRWQVLIRLTHPFYPPLSEQRVRQLWNELNKFLHPYFLNTEVGKTLAGGKCADCPAHVTWDEKAYLDWLRVFQNLVDILVRLLIGMFPQMAESDDGKEGLMFLKTLEWEEKELGHRTIASQHLREFLHTVNSEKLQEQ